MKRITLVIMAALLCIVSFAQIDTAKQPKTADTIRVGGMIIIKRSDGNENKKQTTVTINRKKQKHSNISTAYWVMDFGFANYTDKTNYTSATSQNYVVNRPGVAPLGKDDLKLRSGKSSNVNLWFFMQRLNLIKKYVNLKYGFGIELNNYRFKAPVSFSDGGANPYTLQNIPHAFVFRDSISFSKNKLALDYVTVPFMLNFRTNPDYSKKGLSLSAGVSVGYLYSTRNKQISDERGKHKNHGDYDVEKFKFSYVGELGLGPTRLYGSYTPKSIFKNGLNVTPYTLGIRLSNW
ncbi:MAG: outer membrane beta-barrel protein [Ginsengibacter sp.]